VDTAVALALRTASTAEQPGGDIHAWEVIANLPEAFGHSHAALYNNTIYLAGGEGPSGYIRTEAYYAAIEPDGTLGPWQEGFSLPKPVHYHATAASHGYLYVIGGYSSGAPSNQVYRSRIGVDGALGPWIETRSLPTPLNGPAAAISGNNLYVLGGYSGTHNEAAVYYAEIQPDGDLGEWMTTTSLPEPLSFLSAVTWEGKLYAIAGWQGEHQKYSRQIYYTAFKPEGGLTDWSPTTPLPEAMGNHVAVTSNGFMYVFGGYASESQAWSFYAPIRSDGNLGEWQETMALPVPIHDHSAISAQGHIYVLGGFSDQQRRYQSKIYLARRIKPNTQQSTALPNRLFEDFDALESGQLPPGWSSFGSERVTPKVTPCSSNSKDNLCLYFPYAWHYSNKWLIKDDLDFQTVTATVKLRFLRPVADKAGLVVGWTGEGGSHIQAMPNIYHQQLEFKAQSEGQLLVWESVPLAVSTHTDYWLRIVLLPQALERCRVSVWWSANGTDFASLVEYDDLACEPGKVGVVTEGPGLAEVLFDDFEAVGTAP
jgi:hypothetical protein